MNSKSSFVCIGTGNVGEFLCNALTGKGYKLLQIAGRNSETTRKLAELHNTDYTTDLSKINSNAGFYLMAVSDRSIPDVITEIQMLKAPVIHTSGSTSIDVLASVFPESGVLYPLQSISSSRKTNPLSVPLLLEAGSPRVMALLIQLAKDISGKYQEASSEKRMHAHIAAVFASNFSNHCMAMAYDLMKIYGLDHSLLFPIINETMLRCENTHPAKMQTGPAVRNDTPIIEKHHLALASLPQYQKLYTFVSNSIRDYHFKADKE